MRRGALLIPVILLSLLLLAFLPYPGTANPGQFARPDGTVAAGGWAFSDLSLHEDTDEATPNGDTDYAEADSTDTAMELSLSDVTDPGVSTGHIMRITMESVGGGGAPEKVDWCLREGGTDIACVNNQAVNRGSYTTVAYTLSAAEADSITDYADLRMWVSVDSLGAGENVRVTQTELEVPDAASDTIYYWTGDGDGSSWDDYLNWVIYSGSGWVVTSAGQYPQANDDEAHLNESADYIYLQDGASSEVTLGTLVMESGFTGTVNLSVDLVLDNAAGKDGNLTVTSGSLDVNGSADHQIALDGNLTVSSTILERAGTVIMQGGQTQKVSVTGSQVLYKFNITGTDTVAELYDNLTLYKVFIGSGATLKLDAATRGYALAMYFSDIAGTGFDSTSAGTLLTQGDATYGVTVTTADASPPPTTYWRQPSNNLVVDMTYTTVAYSREFKARSGASDTLTNCTFDNIINTGVIITTGGTFNDNEFTNSGGTYSLYALGTNTILSNITIAPGATNEVYVPTTGGRYELVDSSFDTSKVLLGTNANLISRNHNDVANDYKIMATTLSKSDITNDFASTDNVEIVEGTLTIDEAASSNDFTVDSGATLVLDSGITHTFTASANLSVAGTLLADGTMTTSSGYFDFYNTGSVWLNNTTVSNADLIPYQGGFSFNVGNSANTTVNDLTLTSPSGQDVTYNISYDDWSKKDTGEVWHMNVTAASGSVYFGTSNLTAGTTYESFVDGALNGEHVADGGGWVNFTYDGWSTRHIYLTKNAAPVIDADDKIDRTEDESSAWTWAFNATDADNDALTWAWSTSLPSCTSLEASNWSAWVNSTGSGCPDGTYSGTIWANDSNGGSDSHAFTVTVRAKHPGGKADEPLIWMNVSRKSWSCARLDARTDQPLTGWTVDWGDGTKEDLPDGDVDAEHCYPFRFWQVVEVRVTAHTLNSHVTREATLYIDNGSILVAVLAGLAVLAYAGSAGVRERLKVIYVKTMEKMKR
jgi:hypothetical protein